MQASRNPFSPSARQWSSLLLAAVMYRLGVASRSLHFAVGSPSGLRSSEWVVAASGGDVYITGAGLGNTLKVSLHESGQWQSAFVREFFDKKPDWLEAQTRAMSRWVRPRPLGANVTLAFRLLVPVSELDHWENAQSSSDVRWVAPPENGLVEFQVWVRRGPKNDEGEWPGKTGRGTTLLGELPLGHADAVVVTYLFEPPTRHIEMQLRLMAHIVSRLGEDYADRRGTWKPGLRGFAEVTIADGSVGWLEFAAPSNRPLPDLSPEEMAELGTELVKVKRFADALELFDQALELDATSVQARYNRACVLMLMGKVDEARANLTQLAAAESPRVEPLLNYSAVLLSQGNNDEAAEVLEKATASFPMHAATWHNYGTALRRTGRVMEAERAFRRALSLNPRDTSTAAEVAKCLVKRGQLEHAASELECALLYSTTDGKARQMLASLLVQLRRPEEAVAVLNEAAWTGATVEGRFSRAWAVAEQGDYAGAITAMEGYVANGGRRLDEASTSQALWFLRSDQPAQALEVCENRLGAGSESGFLHAVAALAAVENGLGERAIELGRTAVRLEESSIAVGVLARALLGSGANDAALDRARYALELDDENPDASAVAALARLRSGRADDETWTLMESAIAHGWEDRRFFMRDEAVAKRLIEGSVPALMAAWLTPGPEESAPLT